MVEVGRLLALQQVRVATGGFGGIGMEAPARGAKEVGGQTIGYTMWDMPGNEFLTIPFDCSELTRTTLPSKEVQFGLRLGMLMSADGFIIALDSYGPGTIMEFLAIINLNLKLWVPRGKPKRFAVLQLNVSPTLNQENQGNSLAGNLIGQDLWGKINEHCLVTPSPENAVKWVLGD